MDWETTLPRSAPSSDISRDHDIIYVIEPSKSVVKPEAKDEPMEPAVKTTAKPIAKQVANKDVCSQKAVISNPTEKTTALLPSALPYKPSCTEPNVTKIAGETWMAWVKEYCGFIASNETHAYTHYKNRHIIRMFTWECPNCTYIMSPRQQWPKCPL